MPVPVPNSFCLRLCRLRREQGGATLVTTALALTALMGFAGLGVEVSMWERAQRDMQGAADQAANAAAVAYNAGTSATTAAKGVTAQMGYPDGQGGVTVTVNNPPKSGNYTTSSAAYEVIISKPQPMWFANFFLSANPTVTVRAVATPQTGKQYCIIALDTSSSGEISLQGNPAITTPNCNIKADSSSSTAVTLQGSANITANDVSIVGGYSAGGSATITAAAIMTNASYKRDPYSTVPNPTASALNLLSCNVVGNVGNHSSLTLTPTNGTMRICSSFTVNGTLTLNPGTYYFDGASLTNSGTITGTGVTLVFTSSTGLTYGTASFSANSTTTLTAPSSGTYSGLVIFQDRNAPHTTVNSLQGGATQSLKGDLYFPTTQVTYAGNPSTTSTTCTRLIAWDITFVGSSGFASNCTGVGVVNNADNTTSVLE